MSKITKITANLVEYILAWAIILVMKLSPAETPREKVALKEARKRVGYDVGKD
jgi:hypothetical protein